MTNLINKLSTVLSNTVLFAAGIFMAGLSFVFLSTMALFAFVAVGVALIASPFVAIAQPQHSDAELAR